MKANEIDPLVAALINRLPEPGAAWPTEKRVRWLRAMAEAFGMIYDIPAGDHGEILIE